MSRKAYLWTLGIVYLAWWVLMAIKPKHFDDWLMENILVFLAAGVLVFTYKAFPLSRVSYTCIFVFLVLHALGAHYTYAEVPYQQWFPSLAGGRNHFDRLVHFSYGLLLAYPIREMFLRIGNVRGFWGYFLPLDLTMSTSMLYELIEWAAAETVGSDLGAGRHLGRAQGHGPGRAGRPDRHDHHRHGEPPHATRLRQRMGRKHPRQTQEPPRRIRLSRWSRWCQRGKVGITWWCQRGIVGITRLLREFRESRRSLSGTGMAASKIGAWRSSAVRTRGSSRSLRSSCSSSWGNKRRSGASTRRTGASSR
jgi:putative membrane protein